MQEAHSHLGSSWIYLEGVVMAAAGEWAEESWEAAGIQLQVSREFSSSKCSTV